MLDDIIVVSFRVFYTMIWIQVPCDIVHSSAAFYHGLSLYIYIYIYIYMKPTVYDDTNASDTTTEKYDNRLILPN